MIPKSLNNVPVPASNLIVLSLDTDESLKPRPLWKISRLPVVALTLADTPGTLALVNAVATSESAVPPTET